MPGSLIALCLLGVFALLWRDQLAARESAIAFARQLCTQAGLQFLDQSVALGRLRLVRDGDGLALERHYRFEVSLDGQDRHQAVVRLRRGQLTGFSLPAAAGVT